MNLAYPDGTLTKRCGQPGRAAASSVAMGLVIVLGCRRDTPTAAPLPVPATAAATVDAATGAATATRPDAPAGATPIAAPPVTAPPDRPSRDLKTASFLGLTAPKPATWIEHPARGMGRVVNYTVPGRDGSNAAHVVVSFFGPDGAGPAESNIDRWTQQVRTSDGDPVEPIVEAFEVASMPVTLVELAGEYRRTGAAWYTADQLLFGVIIEAPVGPIYIRFFGETATVERNRKAFLAMLRGLRVE